MNHRPRLQRVTGQPFSVACRHCGASIGAGDGYNTVADLEGEPWRAYFHGQGEHNCAAHAGDYPAGNGIGFRHDTREE